MMNTKRTSHLLLALMLMLLLPLPASAQSSADPRTPDAASCLSGDIYIAEVDYDEASSVDSAEFVELQGSDNASLSGLEMRFVNASGSVYRTISLSAYQLDSVGFLLVGGPSIPNPDIAFSADSVQDTRGGIGLYDTTNNSYCNFINYEGSATSFDNWINIGEDAPSDGNGRSCARSGTGWWSCDKPATPGSANGTVAVQFADSSAQSGMSSALPLLFACLLGLLTLTAARQQSAAQQRRRR